MFGLNPSKFLAQVDTMLAKADSIQHEIDLMREEIRAHSPAPAHGHASENRLAAGGGTPIHYSAPCPTGEGA